MRPHFDSLYSHCAHQYASSRVPTMLLHGSHIELDPVLRPKRFTAPGSDFEFTLPETTGAVRKHWVKIFTAISRDLTDLSEAKTISEAETTAIRTHFLPNLADKLNNGLTVRTANTASGEGVTSSMGEGTSNDPPTTEEEIPRRTGVFLNTQAERRRLIFRADMPGLGLRQTIYDLSASPSAPDLSATHPSHFSVTDSCTCC